MSDRPIFIYAAAYTDRSAAEADYDNLLDLHSAKLVGTYDVALVTKDHDGKVHVHKHEKPTQHGAWGGIAAGALVGILFPPSVLGAAALGGVLGGVGGHFRRGMSRGDARELGQMLDEGEAALVIVGESRLQEQLDKALTRAERSIEKEVDADRDEFKRELREAEKQAATTS
ncbi:MAG TPA: DUF1269 domain-containing protein [Solirubrobacteraceae bacterium]|jgi:uncharacterized membrane protein|nr:DUF1269 domain-containing protein [Solirubrobacteraceae bacterium]